MKTHTDRKTGIIINSVTSPGPNDYPVFLLFCQRCGALISLEHVELGQAGSRVGSECGGDEP